MVGVVWFSTRMFNARRSQSSSISSAWKLGTAELSGIALAIASVSFSCPPRSRMGRARGFSSRAPSLINPRQCLPRGDCAIAQGRPTAQQAPWHAEVSPALEARPPVHSSPPGRSPPRPRRCTLVLRASRRRSPSWRRSRHRCRYLAAGCLLSRCQPLICAS
eukprot:8350701-Pyramimonas_sp.AAC.1